MDAKILPCQICTELMQSPKQKFINPNNECDHPFCSDCITKYIQSKLEDNIAEISCPEIDCHRFLEPLTCRSLVGNQIFVRWCDVICETTVMRFERSYCPNKRCSELIIDECGGGGKAVIKVKCPNCELAFCFKCMRPWHAGFTCREAKRSMRNANLRALGVLAETRNWKKCPQCRTFVERTSGCRNILCRCGCRFCYKCGESRDGGGRCNCYSTGVDSLGFFTEAIILRENRLPVFSGITCEDSDDSDDSDGSDGKDNKENVDFDDMRWLRLDGRRFQISGKCPSSTTVRSCGITTVFVLGKKSMCVVTRDKPQDMKQLLYGLDYVLTCYQGRFKEEPEMKPLAAVTVFVGTDKVNEPVRGFRGLRKAIDFLRDRMKSDFAFTYEETVQTAISVLKAIYQEDLRADDIQARVIREGSQTKESLEVREIEEHLSCVQGQEQPSKLQCSEKLRGLRGQPSSTSIANP